jgi:hypothetical protein
MKIQVAQIKALLAELEGNIQGQLQRGKKKPQDPKGEHFHLVSFIRMICCGFKDTVVCLQECLMI